ncbi:hypothetical protein EV361DRAFT_847381 [Lentinula raphanica]|uniref:non-specific serine/threonine protein kinase n=1 Tax=Lentinula raphanica TaxID=153919 RepID=A0AA38P647_9AGAR|nr:hypothetical protein F5878DRAFT_726369 [Lentinula raphanica]KAJ3971189.1 hypothetical protein EV361DRAFT_847381 [Lentinula raphanica]
MMHLLPISLVLLAVAFYSIADVVTTRNSNKQPNYELSRHPSLNRRSHWSSSTNTGTSAGNDDTLDPLEDSELLDIVLVASVDGKFHALNRTSGHSLWSMPSLAPGQGSAPTKFEFGNLTSLYPSTLAPLVRTVHNQQNNEYTIDEDGLPLEDEIYIIEPQSGTIYILPSDPTSTQTPPLRRFPFTMPELVDMSPFSFSDPDGHSRLFVGRKETSMLVVELETGRVKASVGGECPWDPFDDMKEEEDGEEFELDLDELESEEADEKPVKTKIKPTEVYIGRTDYHISIHARPSRTSNGARLQTPPVQNLSFSTYGPNNQDTLLQSSYSRTKDDSYIQSLPSGELLAFRAHSSLGKTGETDSLLWFRTFSNPIVATFDVLKRPAPQSPLHNDPAFHTFVLLQPQPLLSDFHPSLSHANAPNSLLPNSDSAYVGIVEETGSLYAMSPKGFPFVAFGGADRKEARTHKMTLIDDAPGGVVVNTDDVSAVKDDVRNSHQEDEGGLPVEVDEVTRRRKLREQREREQKELIERASSQALDTCDPLSNVFDPNPRCHIGVHKIEDDPVDVATKGPAGGIVPPTARKLLDAAPITISHGSNAGVIVPETQEALPSDDFQDLPSQFQPIFTFSISRKWEILVALCVGFIGLLGAVAGRYMPSSSSSSSIRHIVEVFPRNAMTPLNPSESSSMEEHLPLPTTPLVDTSLSEPPNASPSLPASNHSESSAEVSAVPPRQPEPQDCEDSEGEVDEAEGAENDATEAGGRKKKIRRKRGKKRKGGAALNSPATPGFTREDEMNDINIIPQMNPLIPPSIPSLAAPLLQNPLTPWPPAPNLALVTATPTPLTPAPLQPTSTLIVSETILGFGSHGTVVFRGSLQGRSVAVKRLLRDFVTLASREVSILQESDDHPNVIRYYYQETHANFLYIALELCPGSLADVYEGTGDINLTFAGIDAPEESKDKEEWQKIRESIMADPKKALKQITSGLKHLHALKLVHRDIKPQNILIAAGPGRAPSALSGSRSKNSRGPSYRMLISDFGLCKKLDLDQTSFLPTAQGAMGAGTFGWRAPEILRGEVKLDNSEDSNSSKGSSGTVNGNNASFNSSSSASGNKATRLTKSVDIFALGCLFYYMLSAGGHPFGDRFEREINIIKGFKDLTALGERYGEEGVDAADLIEKMLSSDSSLRPDTSSCLLHPFFWDSSRRLNFLQDASDRFENMCRDPRDAHLIELEKDALEIIGSDWHSRVDKVFIENLGKFRKYDGKSVQDLLRALRNKKHHYQDLPDNVKRHLGVMPEGYLSYFTRRYPQLFLHTHRVISESELRSEPMFKTYFELAE